MGIRTPDTLVGHTRFPIVLLRPARTSLRKTNWLNPCGEQKPNTLSILHYKIKRYKQKNIYNNLFIRSAVAVEVYKLKLFNWLAAISWSGMRCLLKGVVRLFFIGGWFKR